MVRFESKWPLGFNKYSICDLPENRSFSKNYHRLKGTDARAYYWILNIVSIPNTDVSSDALELLTGLHAYGIKFTIKRKFFGHILRKGFDCVYAVRIFIFVFTFTFSFVCQFSKIRACWEFLRNKHHWGRLINSEFYILLKFTQKFDVYEILY